MVWLCGKVGVGNSRGRVEVGGGLVYVKSVTFQINTLTFPGIGMCQS